MKLKLLFISLFVITNINAQQAHPDYLDGVVFFKITDNANVNLDPYDSLNLNLNQIISDYDITEITHPFQGLGSDTLDLTYKVYFEDTFQVNQLVTEMNLLSWIDYCEKSPLYRTNYTPNDVNSLQWYLDKIDAFEAWDITTGDQNISIAVVDNAVRITHSDLANNIWENTAENENGLDSDLNGYTDDIQGYDVADQDNNPSPPATFTGGAFSHGTHCAGTASGATNNNNGIAGVGYNCKIIGVKCTPDNSNGATLPYAYEGLKYAVDVNSDIISMSWGSRASSFTGDALINNAALNGIVLIAAAGNDDEENALSPASNANVIAVGATNEDDLKASFSNYGADIDLMAPGKSIYNLFGGNDDDYGYSDGTSMACPIVAGAAGLLLSEFPNASREDIRNALKSGCVNIDGLNPGYEQKLGSGRLNLYNSFTILKTETEVKTENFSLYPNPATGHLFLNSAEFELTKEIKIFDEMGRDVTNKANIKLSDKSLLKISGLSTFRKGIYFIRIQGRSLPLRFVIH